jgi:hypothetical protein
MKSFSELRVAAALVSLKGHNSIRRQPNFADRDFLVFKRRNEIKRWNEKGLKKE